VTRRPREGDDPHWQPAQRMTREEAVRSFTIWNARSIGMEGDQGSLEVGKRADLIALSDDVFSCAEETIVGITPTLVMVGGQIVGEA
jgi:predicted amidohydrolase YtcJ